MRRRYVTVDVFTDRAFGGNPLAVVLDAGGLSTAQMQAIAIEFNYSETTFVLPPRDSANDAQVRIFTVTREIPFAGHPNVGTAFVLATQAAKPPARFLFEEGAGLVPVEILQQAGRAAGAELTAPQAFGKLSQLSAGQAAGCGSLLASDISTDRHPPQIVSVGMPFLVAELNSREALRRATPDAAASRGPCHATAPSRSIFTLAQCRRPSSRSICQARMFHPGSSGLTEDPATGSATVAAAAMLADLANERDGELKLRIGQGVDMGRPSLLLSRVVKANGAVVSAHVGGGCVPMMEGTFTLAGEG